MEWVKLTASAIKQAANEYNLAILPLGSIEAHADHLPLGNDTFKVDRACIEATEREAAVVLPPFYYTEVQAIAPIPGAISVTGRILADYTECICDEVGRNGFKKILLVSGHGGNRLWLPAFLTEIMRKQKPYCIYSWYMNLLGKDENRSVMETAFDNHGGEIETSIALHLFPDLCNMNAVVSATTPACSPDLGGAETAYDWPGRWPNAVAGDPTPATPEKGRIFYESCVEALSAVIAKVKADSEIMALKKRYEDANKFPTWVHGK